MPAEAIRLVENALPPRPAAGGGLAIRSTRAGRSYRVLSKRAEDRYVDPDTWQGLAPRREASWWPEWVRWLEARSGAPVPPPPMGAALADAPGTYVLEP